MEQMDVLSTWEEEPDGVRVKTVFTAFGGLGKLRVTDVTGTPTPNIPPDPDQAMCHVTGDTVVMNAIEADINYTVVPGSRVPA